MYAEAWDIVYDIESITQRIYFPREFPLASYDVRVVHYLTREENQVETERCKPLVKLHDLPEEPDLALELQVDYPRINHSYLLMYEPKL